MLGQLLERDAARDRDRFRRGPMEAATKRGLVSVENSAAASRAILAAATLISKHLSARPYSANTSGVLPNVSVSTMSAPPRNISCECRG